ncbi:MAG: hypothetical protein FWB72_02230 [Firmicutes bacterium]|nr:hypothetical protein [Bacillota bacterium]
MENLQTLKVADSKDEAILNLAKALTDAGLEEFAQNYYTRGGNPFFKIEKAKGAFRTIYIDSEFDGYSVHGNYGHEHTLSLENTMRYVSGLIDGTICDIILVAPHFAASAYIENTNDIGAMASDFFDTIGAYVQMPTFTIPESGHYHIRAAGALSMIKFVSGSFPKEIRGEKQYIVYIRLATWGKHEDVFLIQEG